MTATRSVQLNGQKVVLTRDPESIAGHGYHFAQQDGTTGTVTSLGVTMRGPSILKLSAALLRQKQFTLRVDGFAAVFDRSVKPDGTIVWQENPGPDFSKQDKETLALETLTFFKDTCRGLGIIIAKAYLHMLDTAWGSV